MGWKGGAGTYNKPRLRFAEIYIFLRRVIPVCRYPGQDGEEEINGNAENW
jgi:hypothetical protein